jgi:hypothetical protein
MTMRQIRLEAAHRELGSRRPLLTILGRPVAAFLAVLAAAAGLYFAARTAWRSVSGWLAPDPAAVSVPVSHAVSGPVSWMPAWGWAVLVLVVLAVALRYVPRLRFRMKWGFWAPR